VWKAVSSEAVFFVWKRGHGRETKENGRRRNGRGNEGMDG
jgi:protein gp37